ncbi:hypothetical protein C2125_04940 [Rahnella aquatilis]|nr:DUF4062 domain-containing protein [Rahnella aquatilis]RBQ35520.1 hypothetical protein C2125_04940 [Rahnella aquatilis]
MKPIKYQVFLSSTYSDLVEERESIIKAVLEMYHIPIGMEMFSAEDEDQWEIIRRTIEVSDYYILVLGLRYGSKTSDNISFTQKEYEYALERKIPVLAFVMRENVPLPADKRDDNLSEINTFRKLVLTNSKMAQFWETKDQLIRNVSISLMKQIMQKPGIGWSRGNDSGANEALSKELSVLSKENRELRQKIVELESKVSIKAPVISVEITPPTVDDDYYSYTKIEIPQPLKYEEIESHLLEYITETDLAVYNKNIPSEEDLNKYNEERLRVLRINKHSTPLEIIVSNIGTTKANNIYIDIAFSENLMVYEKDENHIEPNSPLPYNPVVRAQSEYNRMLQLKNDPLSRFGSRFNGGYGMGDFKDMALSTSLDRIKPLSQNWMTSLNEQEITMQINSIIHTRQRVFNNEYMIVPLKPGKHTINVRVICEEYEEVKTSHIEFEI